MSLVKTDRYKAQARAYCAQCRDLHVSASRQSARTHVAKTGHTVRIVVEDITVYSPAVVEG